ncbi:polyprenyl synthetase family protein [Halalkalibacterium halodurans]|uniref:polyprenyl synthetase family protein n=1 Tax=Halalkalibacterium halodurans TaxID=86665 RepID=UPI002AAA4200|nr:farnesyl diphosphate synthase [Halalkalibacterium halodurans]MDY7223334.1 farnesyl diphosphate synthase [Halalkalibacterium halodurans]MDY7242555.1 farnesyl diphosphate synthase [Halalkalibacterium halodurans]
MSVQLLQFLDEIKDIIEERMPAHIERLNSPDMLKKSMLYSLKAGGKRIRPALLLATMKSFQKDISQGIDLACAIEMIHTYSLIHDDLPSMDDDDIRRGKPTNHKVFGEAHAILAGDALLTYSFEIVAKMKGVDPAKTLCLIEELARAAGPEGMVGGQVADIEGENQKLTVEGLEYIHHHKTGALLSFAIVAGARLADASEQDIENIRRFSRELGLLFQIKDDILDVEGDQAAIGKPVGSDDGNQKSTYPSLLTLEGAKEKLHLHTLLAKEYLYSVQMNHRLLEELTDYVVNRNH